jgi:hypothetical protein
VLGNVNGVMTVGGEQEAVGVQLSNGNGDRGVQSGDTGVMIIRS